MFSCLPHHSQVPGDLCPGFFPGCLPEWVLELMDSPHLAVEDLSFWDRERWYTARWQQSQDGQTDSLTPS